MNSNIREKLVVLTSKFDSIPSDRKYILKKISGYIKEMKASDEGVNLLYVCTHKSRRSHFGQVAAGLAADFYEIENVHSFSGGTEVTAMNVFAVNALKQFGCTVVSADVSSNPGYQISFGSDFKLSCFSKLYNDASIPKQNVLAIMTCTDAEQNCPFIPSAKYRIGTPYEDPKKSDGTGLEAIVYYERFTQILLEVLYVFSLSK
jgi:arsenate reductase (thioredoxin)